MLEARKIVFLTLIAVISAEKLLFNGYQVLKITPNDASSLEVLRKLEIEATELSRDYQFWQGPSKVGKEAVLMISPEFITKLDDILKDLDVGRKMMIEDVQELIDNESAARNTNEVGLRNIDWTFYNTLEEINQWLEDLAAEFPDVVTILKPGQSHQGRDIVGVKVDYNPEQSKQTVFMEFNIHAREWITSATATYILNEYLRGTNETVRALAEKYTWYFFPVMNPDGFVHSHEVNRMWRKTRTRYNLFCYGADPNRNWGYQWMNGGASQNPCSDIYAGPEPFSEQSVQVMRDFIANITDNMVAYLDFHSFSQMFLLPFGHTEEPLANYDEMMEILAIAKLDLEAVHNTTYTYGNIAETIYIASGSSMDWVKGAFDVPIAVTYELRDLGQWGFLLPPEQIIPTGEETLVSVLSIFREWEIRHPSNSTEEN